MLGSAIGRRCGVYPMQLNDWLVIPCLWGGLIAPPSVLKTPAMTAAISPLRRMEAKVRKEFKDEKEKHEQEIEDQKFKLADFQRRLKAHAKEGADSEEFRKDHSEYRKLKEEIEAGRPKLKRYSTSDSTTEKLGEILQDNPNGVFIFRDELYGFLKSLEKQGRENDRAFYLEAWNGLGSYTFDRIERGTIHVPALCVSIFGGIQPDRLKTYFNQILEGGSGDDGFLSRFQVLLYPDPPETYTYTDKVPNNAARSRVEEIVERIVTTDFRKFVEVDKTHDVPAFRFSPKAQETFRVWYENLNRRLLNSTEDPAFISHLGKYRSLLPALALIFHVVENSGAEFFPLGISEESVSKAMYWVEFLEQHARRVYGQIIQADVHAAHALSKKIEQGKLLNGSTVRDIYRNEWAGLNSPELVRSGIAILSECGWLRFADSAAIGPGPKSEVIELHPDFIKADTL